jgi:hypothetical protein
MLGPCQPEKVRDQLTLIREGSGEGKGREGNRGGKRGDRTRDEDVV